MSEASRHHSFWDHLKFIYNTVLGLNRRNSSYISSLNPREMLPLVDEKIITKRLMAEHDIPSPVTYESITHRFELDKLKGMLSGYSSFVIKPSRGSGGGGIIVCRKMDDGKYRAGSDKIWGWEEIEYHVDEILSGAFALDERPDSAFFEELIIADSRLATFAEGIPDIRFLVVHGVPILSMLRLPTKLSDGRANLHVGGVGVGVDMRNGLTKQGIFRGYLIKRHPDTRRLLAGFQLPHWEKMLRIAADCHKAVPLGYLGVDIVLDENKGPQVLELNARPGLQIQLANGVGLRSILEKVDKNVASGMDSNQRVEYGRELYSAVFERFFDEEDS